MADARTHLYANDARTTLASGISAVATTLQLDDNFADFPSPGVDEIFKVTIQDTDTGDVEICNCTARVLGVLTIERGQEGTVALDWEAGVVVAHRNTAETMEHLEEAVASGGGSVESVVAGTGINVDNTDPANPVVSATGGGGGTAATTTFDDTGLTYFLGDDVQEAIAAGDAIVGALAGSNIAAYGGWTGGAGGDVTTVSSCNITRDGVGSFAIDFGPAGFAFPPVVVVSVSAEDADPELLIGNTQIIDASSAVIRFFDLNGNPADPWGFGMHAMGVLT